MTLVTQMVKNPPAWQEISCNVRDPGSILRLKRSSGEGNGNPLQYSGLGNPMDRGARTRDQTCVSYSGRWILYFWDTREALFLLKNRVVVGMMSKSDNDILYCLNLYNTIYWVGQNVHLSFSLTAYGSKQTFWPTQCDTFLSSKEIPRLE